MIYGSLVYTDSKKTGMERICSKDLNNGTHEFSVQSLKTVSIKLDKKSLKYYYSSHSKHNYLTEKTC